MAKEAPTETQTNGINWAQDQLYELKAQVGTLEQQFGQLQSMATKMAENMQKVEGLVGEAAASASKAPRLQEELNQAVALIVHLQDQQAEANERLDAMSRHREVDENRGQQDWIDVARRTEQLERGVEQWQDRQVSADEVGRRFQEGLSLVRQQLQEIEQRVETAESRAARGLEGATRAEHNLTQTEASIQAVQQENASIIERAHKTADVVQRLEGTLNANLQELNRLELLAERIELHRAERQRLEDRAKRLEEELTELKTRTEAGEQRDGKLGGQAQGIASRLDSLAEEVEEQRAFLVDQMRRLTNTQERTKRRQIQELERELREMKQYVVELTRE